jgi:UDP-N-acetylmuramate--alanine ligase
MNLDQTHSIFFIGIGGIGMSALARYFKYHGKEVFGYDLTPTPLTDQLIKEGIPVQFDENTETLPYRVDLVVFTPAVPMENRLFNHFLTKNVPLRKRSEILGILSEDIFTIAIAGTHGKTSISAMTAHLLKSAGLQVSALIGGICKNYGSNVILSDNTSYLVVEADEYDRSFLTLKPDIAVISSVDADHLDIYGNLDTMTESFSAFSKLLSPDGLLICQQAVSSKIVCDKNIILYGIHDNADIRAENITITNGRFVFDLVAKDRKIKGLSIQVPGLHYVENTLAAISVAIRLGLDDTQIRKGVESFQGVERRFDVRFDGDVVYIDDYAHHPEELKATIGAARMLYPGRKICGVFQPHLYSRTRDFADEFAAVLSELDEVILLDIYPAREKPEAGVSSEMILKKISKPTKYLFGKKELISYISRLTNEVFLTLGAGDIGLLADKIVEKLEKR